MSTILLCRKIISFINPIKWSFCFRKCVKIALKYDAATKLPAIKSLERVSRPGLRAYAKPTEIKRVINGLGIAIISTSKGVLTDKQAKAQNVGGEVLCYIS